MRGDSIPTGAQTDDVRVIYVDNHLFAVIKPAGLLSQGDATGDVDLLTLGRQYIGRRFDKPGNVFLGLVQRLDRPVSGVMVLARTSKSAVRLNEQFRARSVVKRYCAVVEGRLLGSGRMEHRIAKSGKRARIVAEDSLKGSRATLRWRTVAEIGGQALVDIDLETGRPHQIRLQLAEAGHPIAGDRRHGAGSGWPGRGIALHCYALGIEHPTRREPLLWTAGPADWDPAWLEQVGALCQEARISSSPSAASDADGRTRI